MLGAREATCGIAHEPRFAQPVRWPSRRSSASRALWIEARHPRPPPDDARHNEVRARPLIEELHAWLSDWWDGVRQVEIPGDRLLADALAGVDALP